MTTAKTIEQAMHSPNILQAMDLDGKPAQYCGETEQARQQLLAALPLRQLRDYSVNDLISHAYDIVDGRYRRRT